MFVSFLNIHSLPDVRVDCEGGGLYTKKTGRAKGPDKENTKITENQSEEPFPLPLGVLKIST